MNVDLFKEVTQEVAVAMYESQIVKIPELLFFKDDGILQGITIQHTTNDTYTSFLKKDLNMYLLICGIHAMGAGIYVTLQQGKYQKPVEEFVKSMLLKYTIMKMLYEMASHYFVRQNAIRDRLMI